MLINFTKMHGIGNDFVVIDNTLGKFNPKSNLIKNWANRHTGIGFDQLLLVGLAKDSKNDFSYTIYNADGSESYQCGNGARCFALFVIEKGLSTKKELSIETKKGIIKVINNSDGMFSVNMGIPKFNNEDIPFIEQEKKLKKQDDLFHKIHLSNKKVINGFNVNVGNPHTVLFSNDIDKLNIEEIGSTIQNSKAFPEGVNVEFVQLVSKNHIKLRVFERGAGETLACGSGACASVVAGIACGFLGYNVLVSLKGGQLRISWNLKDDIVMTGPAQIIFDGVIEY